ncbi:unnamed protein product [Pocillopora meandrina]|uniref:Uncharacterized protein n=1 Tax=Pocillopora meandrina TaxID=46732 RepID=A0AAU9VVN2_9CNID|nr:unnamed protein product [Pocillopora meandrina]
MNVLLLICSCILSTFALAEAGNCGSRPITRIVGGHEAAINSWPWQVMLRYSSGFPFCGGSLIDPNWVVTATHCVTDTHPSSVKVRLGAHSRVGETVGTEQDIDVAEIITHEKYHSPLRYSHDIALLRLEKPAKLGKGVGLVCLPDLNIPLPLDDLNKRKKCWITGWGRLSSGGAVPSVLQQIDVPLVSKQRCLKGYPGEIHDSMLCAGLDQGGIDACQGDSGGPLVCEFNGKWYLEGVTSWGYGCAAPGKFGVYAKVRNLHSWISKKMTGVVPPKPDCKDSDAFASQCPTLAGYEGYCKHHHEWTRKYCAKSCGWC